MGSSLWNDVDLKPPPNLTCRMTSSEVSLSDLKKLSDVFWDALLVLQNDKLLSAEAATLSRLLIKMKPVFRGDKGYKSAVKVNHCLQKYLSLNIVSLFDNFFRTIPWNSSDKIIYCPTRQMLEYILLRSQGLAALLCRIVHICLDVAHNFKSRMSCGQHWPTALICLSIIGRVWAIAKHLLDSCIKWYSKMLPYLKTLKPFGQPLLPEVHSFPSALTKWLSVPWTGIQESPAICESFPFVESDSPPHLELSARQEISSCFLNPLVQAVQDDLGTSISRSSFEASSGHQFQTVFDDVGVSVPDSSTLMQKQELEEVDMEALVGASGDAESLKITSIPVKKKKKIKSKVQNDSEVKSSDGSNSKDKFVQSKSVTKTKKKKGNIQAAFETISENKKNTDFVEIVNQNEGKKKKIKRKLETSRNCKDILMNEIVCNRKENKKKKKIQAKVLGTTPTIISQDAERSDQSKRKRKKKIVVVGEGEIIAGQGSKNIEAANVGSVPQHHIETQNDVAVLMKKKVGSKIKNLNETLASMRSQSDVQSLMNNENVKRTLTSSLDNNQWMHLKNSINKLHLKLKKAHDEKSKHQLLEKIKKAFKVALS